MATPKEELRFLTKETAAMAAAAAGTPCYVYDEDSLRANARAVMAFPNAFGITPRYAMKATRSRYCAPSLDDDSRRRLTRLR